LLQGDRDAVFLVKNNEIYRTVIEVHPAFNGFLDLDSFSGFIFLFLDESGNNPFAGEEVGGAHTEDDEQCRYEDFSLLSENLVEHEDAYKKSSKHDEIWRDTAGDALSTAGRGGKFPYQGAFGCLVNKALTKLLAGMTENEVKGVILWGVAGFDTFEARQVDFTDYVDIFASVALRADGIRILHGCPLSL
jgi:hypothetical protein